MIGVTSGRHLAGFPTPLTWCAPRGGRQWQNRGIPSPAGPSPCSGKRIGMTPRESTKRAVHLRSNRRIIHREGCPGNARMVPRSKRPSGRAHPQSPAPQPPSTALRRFPHGFLPRPGDRKEDSPRGAQGSRRSAGRTPGSSKRGSSVEHLPPAPWPRHFFYRLFPPAPGTGHSPSDTLNGLPARGGAGQGTAAPP